jgi:hypothetical protein
LDDLVNLTDEPAAVRRFGLRFGDLFLPDVPQGVVRQWKLRIYEEDASNLSDEDFLWKDWLRSLRDAVRVLWKSPDYRSKQFGVFRILEDYFAVGGSRLSPGPVWGTMESFFHSLGPATTFELALMHLLNVTHLTRFCANPECKTPYFWAETKRHRRDIARNFAQSLPSVNTKENGGLSTAISGAGRGGQNQQIAPR